MAAKATGTVSLRDLIQRGVIKPGEEIVIRRRSQPPLKGSVLADGSVRYGGRTYATPTAAAKEALDVGSVSGWLRWRVPRLNDDTLADLRRP